MDASYVSLIHVRWLGGCALVLWWRSPLPASGGVLKSRGVAWAGVAGKLAFATSLFVGAYTGRASPALLILAGIDAVLALCLFVGLRADSAKPKQL